jgi:hypothetical protein
MGVGQHHQLQLDWDAEKKLASEPRLNANEIDSPD